jgi:signal transduction histidine kinase
VTIVRPPLVRPRDAVIGGVCAGLAEHLGVRVGPVRLWAVVTAFLGGAGVLMYLWLWALAPLEKAGTDAPATLHRRLPVAPILTGVAGLSALVSLLLAGNGNDASSWVLVTVVVAGAAVAWSLVFDRQDPSRSARYGVIVRTTAAAVMLVTAILLLSMEPGTAAAVLSVGMIIAGVGVLVAPAVVKLWTDLMAERSARVREESRAEVAAHLHDSVLQTLALIQNRAGPSSEIARIARAQERELRDWLFSGTRPSDADFASQLREVALEIELQHPVRFDVVTTGDFTGKSFPAVLAAAREAMLNAARHAGGDVSVYVELAASGLDVFIRDRGAGFDLDAVPDGRLGVRESIIGRMSRHGGTATVNSGETGTEIHLHLETGDQQ